MKIAVIHGQSHKGVTYSVVHGILDRLSEKTELSLREFFLPKDGPDFCLGCNNCFLKGEEYCPSATKMQPIADAMDWADVIVLDSPNYVLEMSGGMKNLMDHFAYRWVTHRPSGTMYKKVGVAVSSSAGAPAGHTVRSMARQLKWMGCPFICLLPFTCNAFSVADLSDKKRAEMEIKTKRTAKRILKLAANPRASLCAKLFFMIFRKMQSAPAAAWNPKDRDWWVEQGWTKNVRPWKI
jgi:multimeric flavodoxin WrbA